VSRRPILALLFACAAVTGAILAGCGGDSGGGGSVDVGPAAAVPANTPIYLDATIKPTGSTEADARAALGKILDTDDPGAKIASLVEKASKSGGHGINFDQDVKPWLGEKAGVFFTNLSGDDTTDDNTDGTVILETTNPAAALATARKEAGATATSPSPQSYNGSSYQPAPDDETRAFGTVGNFLVEGTVDGFKAAVDASKGDSLGDTSDFKDAIGDLPDNRLGTVYTIPKNFIAALGPDEVDPDSQDLLEKTAGDSLDEPAAGALTATADTIEIDATGGSNGVDTPESALIGDVPAQAWLALGIGDLGNTVKKTLDQLKDVIPNFDSTVEQIQSTTGASLDQLTGAMGDAVIYIEGTTESTLTGALVVKTNDPELTGRLLNQLQGLLALGGGAKKLQLSGGGVGFQINDPSVASVPIELAQQGDEFVVGYGANSAERTLTPAQKLSDAPTFSAADSQVSSLGTDLFLDFPSIFALAESSGAKSDPGFMQAKPYLDALSYLVTGSGTKGDQAEFKAVLGLK
jgi:hypothetical protein